MLTFELRLGRFGLRLLRAPSEDDEAACRGAVSAPRPAVEEEDLCGPTAPTSWCDGCGGCVDVMAGMTEDIPLVKSGLASCISTSSSTVPASWHEYHDTSLMRLSESAPAEREP